MPDWENAIKSKNDKVEVVEALILSQGSFGYALEESHCEWQTTKDNGYITSLPRLVVMKLKKTNETVSFIMTLVGDKQYLEKKKFKLSQNSYLSKDKDFSGLVLFHDLKGNFVNGWRFTDGKVSHTVTINFEREPQIQLKSGYLMCSTSNIYMDGIKTVIRITG